ncbi:MAG: phosphotransferase [Aestuariivita sp.]|nr:phosphotransferase [Aestuariivita sp.]MCY4346426.1 phosphotransferase [Aestuariivita sp.]
MPSRDELKRQFLNANGWSDATPTILAADASHRSYTRLRQSSTCCSAILMDAPKDLGEDVRPFVFIAKHLYALGFSAPQVLAQDDTNGFLLLEDLGDDLFARVLERDTKKESLLYLAAVDALISLHQIAPPDLPTYSVDMMLDLSSLAFSRYRAAIGETCPENVIRHFRSLFEPHLRECEQTPPVLIQRDYHAENLLWLPDRHGIARVGMLDFQDGMLGHPAYDLVSLLEDARRDVSKPVQIDMRQHYMSALNTDTRFDLDYAVLGVQRNLRILGVFARLSIDRGRTSYIDLIPRVWGYLCADLRAPELKELEVFIRSELPEPTNAAIRSLKNFRS